MKRIRKKMLCILLALCAVLEPVSAAAAATIETDLFAENVLLIPGPEDYFGQPESRVYNEDKERIEYTFDAAMNPRTKMKLYGGVLEEDFGLTLKADKETDDGYLVRLSMGSKNGIRVEWFEDKESLVVYCYTRLLPKTTESSKILLTVGAEDYPQEEVEALVKALTKKFSMKETSDRKLTTGDRILSYTKNNKNFLDINWDKSAGILTLAAYDEDILDALGLEERYYIDKNSAALPDLGSFLDRKCISDQWSYARAITYTVEKTKGEKAFKEVLSLLKEERYQLEQIKSWEYKDGSKKCTDYTFRYNGDNELIDWVQHNDGYQYHVKLTKKIYSHKLEIILYCWPEFYLVDPISRSKYAGQLTPVEPEPDPDPTQPTGGGGGGTNECKTCFGSGKCWACSGKGGKYRNVIGEPWKQVFEACRVCHNGKKCTSCKGKGYK